MRAQPVSLENLVRKAVTMAHLGRRGQPVTTEPIKHRIMIPSSGKNRRAQAFESEFVGGGAERQSLLVVTLDDFEVLRARLGPDFKNNPDRLKIESIAKIPSDWRELFMALPLYASASDDPAR